jgi:acyl-coenzyme A thioesterase PaaI-like protein
MTNPQLAAERSIPAGMKKLHLPVGFMGVNGPLWGRLEDDGLPVMGFFVEERHVNPGRVCHGGMLMTFADMLLGFTVSVACGGKKFLPTIQLGGDFVGPAPLGAWVEGKGRLVRQTRNMGFTDALITADGAPCLRANGIMKIPSQENPLVDFSRVFG